VALHGVGERSEAVVGRRGEVFEDAQPLRLAAAGADGVAEAVVGHDADRLRAAQPGVADGRGQRHRVLQRGLSALTGVDAALHVEDDHDVGVLAGVEDAAHELAGLRRGAPVDARQAVGGLVVTDARDVRRDVDRTAAADVGEAAASPQRHHAGDGEDRGVDQHLGLVAGHHATREEAEGVAEPRLERTEVMPPAAVEHATSSPRHRAAACERERSAGGVPVDDAAIPHLAVRQPQRARVLRGEGLGKRLADHVGALR
jgi:hypothetical protein